MKRKIKYLAASLSALLLVSGLGAAATIPIGGVTQVNYQFVINDDIVQLPSQLMVMSRNNTTYVPLRFLSEQMGVEVDYMPGTVTLKSNNDSSISGEVSAKRIAELKADIEKLESENKLLKDKIAATEDNLFYKKLPASVTSGNGLEARLTGMNTTSDGVSMYIELVNSSETSYIVMDPLKTVLTVDGVTYEGSIGNDISLLKTLVPAPSSNQTSSLGGRVEFKGLKETNIKGSLLINYSDDGVDQKMQLLFDNTK